MRTLDKENTASCPLQIYCEYLDKENFHTGLKGNNKVLGYYKLFLVTRR